MFELVRQLLSPYQLEANAFVAPSLFALCLLIIRAILLSLVTTGLKNMPKDDRKKLKKHYQERSLIGWAFWIGAWALPSIAYFTALPAPLDQELYLISAIGLLMLLSVSAHFLAFAQASIQILSEKKSLSLVG